MRGFFFSFRLPSFLGETDKLQSGTFCSGCIKGLETAARRRRAQSGSEPITASKVKGAN